MPDAVLLGRPPKDADSNGALRTVPTIEQYMSGQWGTSDAVKRARIQKQAKEIARQMKESGRALRQTTSAYWKSGMWVVFVVGAVALYFVYEYVLGRNKVLFGVLVIALAVSLLATLGRKVKETGAVVAGGLDVF